MAKAMILIGKGDGPAPSASTAEAAAQGYFTDRQLMGVWASKPPIHRWRPDDRKRFEAELSRLEAENRGDAEDAMAQAAKRPADAK